MFPVKCPKSVAALFLDVFSVFRSGRAVQILFLEISKDCLADNRDAFTYGGSENQTVIL